MKNSFVVIGSMLLLASWVVEPKPQGCNSCGSSHKEITEKCCNKCELCRVSFDVVKPTDPECIKPKNYTYNVKHFKTNCRDETFGTLNAEIERPLDPECPKSHPKHYCVEKPPTQCCSTEADIHDFEINSPVRKKHCKKLKLSAKIDYKPRHCECDCGYENYRNKSLLNNSVYLYPFDKYGHKILTRVKRSDPNFEKFKEQYRHPNSRRFRKRSKPDNTLCMEGYVCRCVPESESEKLFAKATTTEEPMVGNFLNIFSEEPVYIGGGQPPSYQTIRERLDSITSANEGQSTVELITELGKVYYQIYKNRGQRNYSLPIKYGTKTTQYDDQGLRTYDIQPVDGEYEPSAWNALAGLTNEMFGRLMDNKISRLQQRRKFGIFNNNQQPQNSFMQLLNTFKREKRRQCARDNRLYKNMS